MIYFASDVHLGAPTIQNHREHEKRFVAWLDHIKPTAKAIYLLGDIFDFWFEYKKVVPRGHTRLLGKLAEITDAGIPVHFFTGNHDIWVFDYLPSETGVIVYRHPIELNLGNKRFYLAHGDGLGGFDKNSTSSNCFSPTSLPSGCFLTSTPILALPSPIFGLKKAANRTSKNMVRCTWAMTRSGWCSTPTKCWTKSITTTLCSAIATFAKPLH
jgi:UDP-2,3-diacylglucosamine pyrophosphatase LpxH